MDEEEKGEDDCLQVERRAHGEVICPDCGREYRRHPWYTKRLGMDDQPYLRQLCDGTLVKL